MTLHEQLARLREWLLDDTSDASDQDDEHYRWSTAELIGYLSESQNESCRRGDLIYAEDIALTLAADTSQYSIPYRILKLNEVIFDDQSLERTTLDIMRRHGSWWRDSSSSRPTCYAVNARTITLYPSPDATNAALTCNLAGYVLPSNNLSVENPTPEIHVSLHPHLLYYAAHLAYLKRDEETYNPGLAEVMEQKFAQYFGPRYRADAMIGLLEAGNDLVVRIE